MKTKIMHSYIDPGHGWVKAPRKLLEKLGIERDISPCSYQRGEFTYLEEDCDAPRLFAAMRNSGTEPAHKFHYTDRTSKIRGYESFKPKEVQSEV